MRRGFVTALTLFAGLTLLATGFVTGVAGAAVVIWVACADAGADNNILFALAAGGFMALCVAKFSVGEGDLILFDAAYREDWRETFFYFIDRRGR